MAVSEISIQVNIGQRPYHELCFLPFVEAQQILRILDTFGDMLVPHVRDFLIHRGDFGFGLQLNKSDDRVASPAVVVSTQLRDELEGYQGVESKIRIRGKMLQHTRHFEVILRIYRDGLAQRVLVAEVLFRQFFTDHDRVGIIEG